VIDADGNFEYKGSGILFSRVAGIIPGIVEGYDDIRRLCPSFIDNNDFLGAVYEMNREKRLSHAFCRTMLRGNEELTVWELIQELKLRLSEYQDSRKSIIFYV
jgi:hypothetical protein